MQNKFILNICLLVLLFSSTMTYAATNASLWGTSDIDKPVAPIEQIEQEQKQAQALQQELANQKTVCEILSAQPSLSTDAASSVRLRDALAQAYKVAIPDYKMFLVNPEASNDLYTKYRDMYLKTYCLASH